MIYESWSLMIKEVDETFFEQEEIKELKKQMDSIRQNIDSESFDQQMLDSLNEKSLKIYDKYEKELKINRSKLLELLDEYELFNEKDIVSTFMHIYKTVINEYENTVINSFGPMSESYFSSKRFQTISLRVGFAPFSLLTESGARINFKNFKKINYIKDPEIKYLKRTNQKLSLLSITESIDDIFNNIFQQINKLLGEKTFLKLFMRRTLFGCEFGICFNFSFDNCGLNDPYCLIDKDPMILFTLCVKSFAPILAGILIAFLVYVTSIAKDIAEWIIGFPEKLTKELILKGVFVICNIVSSELMNFALDKFIKSLKKKH